MSAYWCFCVRVGYRLVNSLLLSEPTTLSWVVRLSSHMGAEKHPTVGSSGEYWSMNESLNQHYAEDDRSLRS